MKKMALLFLQVIMMGLVITILIITIIQKRTSRTPHDVVYRHRLIEVAVSSTSNSAIVITDEGNNIKFWNTGAEKLFGYKESEMLNRSLTVIGLSLPDFILKNTPLDTDAIHRLQSSIPINLTVSECKVGDAVHYAGYMKNIRERKEREAQMKLELELLNIGEEVGGFGSFIWSVNSKDIMPDRIMVSDGFNRIFETDDMFSDMQYLMSRIWHEDQQRIYAELQKAQEAKEDYVIEYRLQQRSGKIIWVRGTGRMELTANGHIEKIVGCIQKIKKNV